MKTKEEILSEVSGEGLGTLRVMLKEEPNAFRFSITEVYVIMDKCLENTSILNTKCEQCGNEFLKELHCRQCGNHFEPDIL